MRMYIISITIPNPPNIKKSLRHNKCIIIWITNRKSNNSHLKFPQPHRYNIYTDQSPSSQNQQDRRRIRKKNKTIIKDTPPGGFFEGRKIRNENKEEPPISKPHIIPEPIFLDKGVLRE